MINTPGFTSVLQ